MFENSKAKLLDIFLDKFDLILFFGLTLLFGIGGLFVQAKLSFFILGSAYGAYLSFAALPILNSDKWALKPLICAALGALLTAALGVFQDWTIKQIILGGIAGLALGYFAPVWAKYL